jgi:cysteine desulfurase
MTDRTYLDWNATAPLCPEARAATVAALDELGNPSSVHREGRAVRRLMEQARERVAALVGAEPRNVVFTSGAT